MSRVKYGEKGYCQNPNSYHYSTVEFPFVRAGFKEECCRSCVLCLYFEKVKEVKPCR